LRKKVSRAEVAKTAGVAESTVSRALNDSTLISDEVKKKIKKIASELGYIPNRQAVLLASKKTMRVGLVVRTYKSFSPFTRSYFPRLLDGVLLKAEALGYSVTIVLDKVDEKYKDLSEMIYSKELDGFIFSVTPLDDPRFEGLMGHNVPFVLVNNIVEGADCVNCDPYAGTRDALSHLKGLGHKHVAYIQGDINYWDGKERLAIFKKLCTEQGMGFTLCEGNFSKRSGVSAAEKLLNSPNRPTAIMAGSDRCALGVMEYCKKENIKIPEDISLIGFDNLGPAQDSVPGLSTIHNPVVRMGSDAMDLLSQRLSGKIEKDATLLIDSGFIIRESTGVPYEQ
jgi:LacI family transcriptional regulator, galactose operon repressor